MSDYPPSRTASTPSSPPNRHFVEPVDWRLRPIYQDGKLDFLQPKVDEPWLELDRAIDRAWSDVATSPEGVELELDAETMNSDRSYTLLNKAMKRGLKINKLTWSVDPLSLGLPWQESVKRMLSRMNENEQDERSKRSADQQHKPRYSTIKLTEAFEPTACEADLYDLINEGAYDWDYTLDPSVDPVAEGKAIVLKFLPDSQVQRSEPPRSLGYNLYTDSHNNRVMSGNTFGSGSVVNQGDISGIVSFGSSFWVAGSSHFTGPSRAWNSHAANSRKPEPSVTGEREKTVKSLAIRAFEARGIPFIIEGMANACSQTGVQASMPYAMQEFCEDVNTKVKQMQRKNPSLFPNSKREDKQVFISDGEATTKTLLEGLSRGVTCDNVNWDCSFDSSLMADKKVEPAEQVQAENFEEWTEL